MPWNERSLLEYEFRFGPKQRQAVARLGFPEPDGTHQGEWVCSFQIEGLKDNQILKARGEDGLQALTVASMAVRASLDRLKEVASDAGPYETVFPRYLPFCYGLEFHRELCGLVDAHIKKKDAQIARRRRRRNSSA